MAIKLKYFVWLILLLIPGAAAQARTEQFTQPNIKEDYCGVHIGAYFCKCAFHGQYCDAAKTDKRGANAMVWSGFQTFVEQQIAVFGMQCMEKGGIYSVIKTHCEYCEDGKVRSNGVCVRPDEKRPLEEVYGLPKVESEGGTRDLGWVVAGEGEFFVFSPGRGKWIGPVSGGLTLFEGDVLYTTMNGRATIRLGSSNMAIAERTMFRLPTPKKERSALEQGALFIWESVKRLATNQPFEIEGGAHSISGIKGTKFLMEVEGDVAKYAVSEGLIDVWVRGQESSKTEVGPGSSVQATPSGVEPVPYDWDALEEKYDLKDQDLSEPTEAPKKFAAIDPDAIDPPEAAYTGDLVGDVKVRKPGGNWAWLLVLALLAGGGYYYMKRRSVGKKAGT